MNRTGVLSALLLLASLITAPTAEAQRRGFIIGFGIGPGLTTWTTTVDGFGEPIELDRSTKIGVATDFRIGAALSRSLQLYYVNKVHFFGDELAFEGMSFDEGTADLLITGLTGLGTTYVLPSAPAVSFSGAIGIASWIGLYTDDVEVESSTGLGLAFGVGYEFADLWILDLALMWSKLSEEEPIGAFFSNSEVERNVIGVKLAINILSH